MLRADHITGGEMFYTYTGISNGLHRYEVTLKLFMRCNSGRQFPDPAIISVFDKGTYARLDDISVDMFTQRSIAITNHDPCITNPPAVCYEVAFYNFTVWLPVNQFGYILASQVNYRINGISNLDGSTQIGATYTCEIPGDQPRGGASINNSAVFTGSDLVVVCAGNYFSYSFAAKDPDGDELRYSFCAAYRSSAGGINGVPAGSPPYYAVPYGSPGYMEGIPMGGKVTIDARTGLITGVAPPGGIYVITVCVEEVRNGAVIATQRKDLQINVADCSVAAAMLEEDYMVCGESRTATIINLSNSPLIASYDWTVFDPGGNKVYTTRQNFLQYTFPVNGRYAVQLIVNKDAACTDTSQAPVYVYPGLVPLFTASGICITNPTLFHDRSTVTTGAINSWKWDFGQPNSHTDTSSAQNPVYTYTGAGAKNARLIVTTTEGCRDTITKTIDIVDKPPIRLAFRDTTICVNDQLQLKASGDGIYTWSSADGTSYSSLPSPIVSPTATTRYFVDLNLEGCLNRDSVLVRVTDHVVLQAMRDTVICANDTIQLRIISDGLRYEWTPAAQLNNAGVKSPFAITSQTSNYQVTAYIGGCSNVANILVSTVPYPVALAGSDTVICYNTNAQLHAYTNGSNWAWTGASLTDAGMLHPVVSPPSTQAYIFTATGNRGCPKPVSDTVLVTVLPRIVPALSRDTVVVLGQPVQLTAGGGDSYSWSPAFALSATDIANPVATFHQAADGLRYKVDVYNSAGCYDSAFIVIKVYATPPTVFVPTAFTPNHDGINDVLRPVIAGMKRFEVFQVFNRWGQMVFSTSTQGQGWDGTVNGYTQSNNVYVWVVKAIDYNGAPYFKRGTVTLIR